MTIEWRPYQTEIMDAVFTDWQEHSSLLAVAATGAGKTNMLWGITDRFLTEHPGARVIVLAHRKELIEQPKARLAQFWPHLVKRAGIVMATANECHRQIVIATVQTLGHSSGKRMKELLGFGKISLLIVDEAHHVSAASYQSVIDALSVANPELKILGVTATPNRSDKKSIAETFDKESANVGVIRLIEEGHLCQPKLEGVTTNIDLSGVSVQGSGEDRDYNKEQLIAAVETDDCFKIVVKTHMDYIKHRPTIAFVPSVNGAYRLAELLQAQGIKAVAADAKTPAAERSDILTGFKEGRYTTLCNVALWTEGLDLPQLECCHLVRPTKSDSLWLQMVGRVLRNHPGKDGCDIFDYKPLNDRNVEQHMKLLGIEPPKPPKGIGELPTGDNMGGTPKQKAGDVIEYVILNYFNKRKESWVTAGAGWRIVGLGKGEDGIDRSVAVSPDGTQLWVAWKKEGERWHSAHKHAQGSFALISSMTDVVIKKHARENIVKATASWRYNQPSDSQISFGRKLRVYEEGMNRGKLSDAINQKLVMDAISRNSQKVAA